MKIDETGFYVYWRKKNRPPKMDKLVERCIKWKPTVTHLTRLSLKGLSGAFLVLAVGYVLSLGIFVLEFFVKSQDKSL